MLAFGIVWIATAASDEGGIAWGTRTGRSLPLVPLCCAFGTWLTLTPRRTREELAALEAVGRSPRANAMGAVAGGIGVSVIAAAALAVLPMIDAGGFFPVVARTDDIRFEDGRFVDRGSGWRFEQDGSLQKEPAPHAREGEPGGLPRGGRTAAAVATAVAGAALALIVASTRRRTLARAACALAAVSAMGIFVFHAAAARAAPSFVVVLPPIGLLTFGVWSYRGWGWETERTPKTW